MGRSNKGFSLVELIVALAIFGIAGVAVFGFMVNSTHLYKRSNEDMKVQYEQQLAVNQIRDMVVESDRGIYFDEASQTLALYGALKNDGGTDVCPVTVIRYVETEQKLYFGTKEFDSVSEITFTDITADKLLVENVTVFKVDLSKVKKDKVLFEIEFKVGDEVQKVTETVALRNRLVVSNQVDAIWEEEAEVIESFIQKITISRGTKEFTYDEEDTIGKYGESVLIAYSAEVVANEESDRDYAVAWRLEGESAGISVDANGTVTVLSTVPSSTMFYLYASSVDEPDKETRIRITVTDFGLYPESMTLEIGDTTEGNGFKTYKLLPTLIYSDGTPSSDYNLFIWEYTDSLPEGCTFNKQTGVLTLGPGANGKKITITAKAKERKADGTVLSDDREISIGKDEIKAYVPGPTVKIKAATNLSRGGYVFPTMVFENATHSNYTYNWTVVPYKDEESEEFTQNQSPQDTLSFYLISLAEKGEYNAWNVRHEMTTDATRRTITLNCAPQLNWNKTFKVKVSGTATDKEGNVLTAEPVIVTIEPVEFWIEPYGGVVQGEDESRPVLTNSTLMYEDWIWRNLTPETDATKWDLFSRRWFYVKAQNLNIKSDNWQQTQLVSNFSYYDAGGVLINSNNIWGIQSPFLNTKMLCGFKVQLMAWEQNVAHRPSSMHYWVVLKDNYGNTRTSNVEEFSVVYEFYYPETTDGGN